MIHDATRSSVRTDKVETFQRFFATTPCLPFPVSVLVLYQMLHSLFCNVNVLTLALPRAFLLLLAQLCL